MFNHDVINFQVSKVPLYVNDPELGQLRYGAYNQVDNNIGVGIQRDNGEMLGIVSENY